ncbi:MAG: F0F1 ATP synthase subunit delta [Oscillospiraceae bacterium]|nr:F0F1 ATP synthase subunit delta [Oscillospiraceae bacterium]
MSMQVFSAVYAAALMEIAREDGTGKLIFDELNSLSELVSGSPELNEVLCSPTFSEDEKYDVAESLFKGKLSRTVLNFLYVLIEEGRTSGLSDIASDYKRLYYEQEGITEAVVTTAAGMSRDAAEKLKAKLEAKYKKKVLLSEKTDPSIMGGVIVRVGDEMIDGSLRTKLDRIGKQM